MRHLKIVRARLTPLLNTQDGSTAVEEQLPAAAENSPEPSKRRLEIAEENRKGAEERRRNALDDRALKIDLEKQYGETRWAKNLIKNILDTRGEVNYRFET